MVLNPRSPDARIGPIGCIGPIGIICLTLATAGHSETETLIERMDDARERILSKHGVEIEGGIDAEYFRSGLDGSAVDPARHSYETTQFTAFDLDMRYRPYDFVGARAILRFHQDWQTFFATRSRIVGARWLSMDGNIARMLSFNAGDFRQKYTPLTLWAPELDLAYEPDIFSEARARLMQEQFLGRNFRPLQGLNLSFAKRLRLPLSEIRADAIGSRVRRPEYLDGDGWQALKLASDKDGDGDLDTLSLASSDMDRFLLAGNGEILLWDNIVLGGTVQALVDDRESFQPAVFSQRLKDEIIAAGQFDPGLGIQYLDGLSLNNRRSVVARDLRVMAFHGGLDAAGFLSSRRLTLELLGEIAQSSESNVIAWHFRRDSTSGVLVDYDPSLPGRDGAALNLQFAAGYASEGRFGWKLEADWLNNEADFLNPLAQSPTFVATRIMNTENDLAGGALYSTFDALDNGVYKFTPASKTGYYHLAPFSKTSYHSGVFTGEQLGAFSGDPVVQLLLPMGMATPNRTGFKTRVSGSALEGLHALADFARLQQLEGEAVDSLVAEAADYTQMGGGLKAELDKLLGWPRVSLSASFARSAAERAALPDESASPAIRVDLVQAGLTWRFLGKWGVLGGYQWASLESPATQVQAGVRQQYDMDEDQGHFRLGLEYALSRQAYFLVSGGLVQVERRRTHRGTSAGGAADPSLDGTSDFSQTVSQVLVKVRF